MKTYRKCNDCKGWGGSPSPISDWKKCSKCDSKGTTSEELNTYTYSLNWVNSTTNIYAATHAEAASIVIKELWEYNPILTHINGIEINVN